MFHENIFTRGTLVLKIKMLLQILQYTFLLLLRKDFFLNFILFFIRKSQVVFVEQLLLRRRIASTIIISLFDPGAKITSK